MNFALIARLYFKKEMLILLFLGISSGLPLALLLTTLKTLLVDNNVDIKAIGFFSLVTLPYSIKFLWAPLVDSIQIPYFTRKLGIRRSWMLLSQVLLMILIIILGIFSTINNLSIIVIIAVSIGFVSATQDIAIDAYRIEYVKIDSQGIATTMYIYGYRIGLLISGALALLLSDNIAWDMVYYFLAIVMLIGITSSLVAEENLVDASRKSDKFFHWFRETVISPLSNFMHKSKCYMILCFVILFKLCDAVAGSLTLPFLIDINFSKSEIATIVKTFGLFATLFGVFCGGILVKLVGLVKSLWVAIFIQMISNLAFYYQSIIGYDPISLYIVIFIENFSGGVGDAVFVVYLSSLCNKKFAATQYAILASLAAFGRGLLSSLSGIIVDMLGWDGFFLISTIMAFPGIILLFLLTRSK